MFSWEGICLHILDRTEKSTLASESVKYNVLMNFLVLECLFIIRKSIVVMIYCWFSRGIITYRYFFWKHVWIDTSVAFLLKILKVLSLSNIWESFTETHVLFKIHDVFLLLICVHYIIYCNYLMFILNYLFFEVLNGPVAWFNM